MDRSDTMVIVPTIIERNASAERVYDLYSCLLKERIIILTGEIDDTMSSSVCAQLLYLSSTGSEPILMYINSPGGSVSAGLAIYDTMNYIKCDVQTIAMGMCASMAAVLLCAGAKGKRCALTSSEVMIHQPLGGMQGQAKDMEIAAAHMQKMKHKLYRILSKQTGKDMETITIDCDRDYYMDAEEAKEYGLIDSII